MLTSKARAKFTEGEVLNLMSMDGQTVVQFIMMTNIFAVIPVLLLVPLIFLCFVMGWPTLVGIFIMALNVFICDYYGKKVETLQEEKNTLSDERSSILNEIFQGIRTVKLNAWETSVAARVKKVRKKEINVISKMNQYRALQTSLSWATPAIAMMLSFVLYSQYINKLTPAFVFLALPLFTQANLALVIIPMLINEYRRYLESTKRLGAYLFVPNDYKKLELSEGDGHVIVENATFEWGVSLKKNEEQDPLRKGQNIQTGKKEDTKTEGIELVDKKKQDDKGFVLENITFEMKPKQLIAVVGRVASGKSTLGASILGLVTKTNGILTVKGKTAYVSQEAFIMNETVRENILFGNEFEQERYDMTVKACEMSSDMELFVNKDMTQVGEKGITISGGQRQRIAIARAAYSKTNVIIFDDPLSAMDAHVGKLVFDNCISNNSIMQDRTRIFITNQLQYCEECDYILCMDNGVIVEEGTYDELMNEKNDNSNENKFNFFRNLNAHQVGISSENIVDATTTTTTSSSTNSSSDSINDLNDTNNKNDMVKNISDAHVNSDNNNNNTFTKQINKKKDDQKSQSNVDYDLDLIMIEELKGTGRVGMSEMYRTAKRAGTLMQFAFVVFFIATVPFIYWTMTLFLALWSEDGSTKMEGPMLYYIIMAILYAFGVAFLIITVNDFFLKNSERLHNEMLDAVLECPMRWFDTTPVGRIMNRFNNDIMNFDLSSPRNFEQLVNEFGRLWIGILPLCFLAPPLIIIAIPFTFICYFFFQIYARISLIVHRLYLVANSPVLAAFSAWLQGLDTIRAFDKVGRFKSIFTVNHALLITAMNNSSAIDRLFIQFTPPMIINNCTILVAIGLILMKDMTVGETNEKFISPGLGGLILTGMIELCFRLPHYFWLHSTQERFLASGKRIVEYADLIPEKSSTLTKKVGNDDEDDTIMVDKEWPRNGAIVFHNVSMRYREKLPLVLKSVSFSIQDGERVAIVGRTGAGKSSILLTLLRMMEIESGNVKVDGVDIKSVSGRTLRSRFGMIPQDSFILQGTIRSNLDLEGTCDDDALWKVLELVDLKKLVETFDEKLDHRVEERGSNLSAGTVQLMCLARVLIDNPKIIIMDEATSSVDIETDALVQTTIRQVCKGKTIISIAHRLQTVIDFDKVLVLNEGEVAEFNHPHLLLQNEDGIFSSLVKDTGETSATELLRRAKEAYDDVESI